MINSQNIQQDYESAFSSEKRNKSTFSSSNLAQNGGMAANSKPLEMVHKLI